MKIFDVSLTVQEKDRAHHQRLIVSFEATTMGQESLEETTLGPKENPSAITCIVERAAAMLHPRDARERRLQQLVGWCGAEVGDSDDTAGAARVATELS